jgi:hypothetical protein
MRRTLARLLVVLSLLAPSVPVSAVVASFVLTTATPAQAAYTLIAHRGDVLGVDGGTSGSFDSTGADLCIAVVHYYTGGPDPALSDSRTLTWVGLTAQEETSESAVRIFYAKNITGGAGHNFTVTGTGTFAAIEASCWSGSELSAPFDVENGANSFTPQTTSAPGSVTPSEANELVVWTSTVFQATATMSSDLGAELDETASAAVYSGATYYQIQTSITAVNPTQAHTSYKWASAIATFKAAPVVGGAPRMLLLGCCQ